LPAREGDDENDENDENDEEEETERAAAVVISVVVALDFRLYSRSTYLEGQEERRRGRVVVE
jgi:hypothetical protein